MHTLRLTEWSHVSCDSISAEDRDGISAAIEGWRLQNGLFTAPIHFEGPNGAELHARQFVGVVEVDDVAIEIYPKLDAELINASDVRPLSPAIRTDTVMRNLLWMLEVANFTNLADTATAHLDESPTNFFDLFAYLLGKNLLPQLEQGVAHAYVARTDNCKTVRGRIDVAHQLTRNWNRHDQIRCAWDEFTPDIAINRLLKCACRFLSDRVNYAEAARLLTDCRMLLGEVEDVSPAVALVDIDLIRFDRSQTRFSTAFDLAKRLLMGVGHNLGVGTANTFVFLIDMNDVFEKYVHAVLEAHFATIVEEQKFVGRLLNLKAGGIHQFADYLWRGQHGFWIGDAKYKHLAKGQVDSLRFEEFERASEYLKEDNTPAGRVIDPSDVRQLTVYAELAKLRWPSITHSNLVLLYPFVGEATKCDADRTVAWNGNSFWLVPVLVKPQPRVGDSIRVVRSMVDEGVTLS